MLHVAGDVDPVHSDQRVPGVPHLHGAGVQQAGLLRREDQVSVPQDREQLSLHQCTQILIKQLTEKRVQGIF